MADRVQIFCGDCLQVLPTLEAGSIQCCVTSPPYWGLRDYGTAKWEGGDPGCDHGVQRWDGPKQTQGAQSGHAAEADRLDRNCCHKCGAVRVDNQIGLERSPDEYVAKLVQVFREVRRVLRDDGTLWLNLGDSYASGKGSCFNPGGGETSYKDSRKECGVIPLQRLNKSEVIAAGMKPKDLVGIPWMVAFALRADGWYLRSDIIWHKPNPMPESVRDRPTKAHEYLFLLAKSDRYFYDGDAVREPHSRNWQNETMGGALAPGSVYQMNAGTPTAHVRQANPPQMNPAGRNRRTVWTISTKPYKGAHFATFPPALVEPCIKAGTSERGCCPMCGKAWERVIKHIGGDTETIDRPKRTGGMNSKTSTLSLSGNGSKEWAERGGKRETLGFRPSCSCEPADPIPCAVLDPFAGSGTVGAVALELGRSFVGIELNSKYIDLIRERINGVQVGMSI